MFGSKKKGQVTYTSVIVPSNTGEIFDITCEALDPVNSDINACRIEIADQNGVRKVFYYAHNNEDEGTYSIGGFTADAMVTLVQVDHKGKVVETFSYK